MYFCSVDFFWHLVRPPSPAPARGWLKHFVSCLPSANQFWTMKPTLKPPSLPRRVGMLGAGRGGANKKKISTRGGSGTRKKRRAAQCVHPEFRKKIANQHSEPFWPKRMFEKAVFTLQGGLGPKTLEIGQSPLPPSGIQQRRRTARSSWRRRWTGCTSRRAPCRNLETSTSAAAPSPSCPEANKIGIGMVFMIIFLNVARSPPKKQHLSPKRKTCSLGINLLLEIEEERCFMKPEDVRRASSIDP